MVGSVLGDESAGHFIIRLYCGCVNPKSITQMFAGIVDCFDVGTMTDLNRTTYEWHVFNASFS